jgi:hypothetical protein
MLLCTIYNHAQSPYIGTTPNDLNWILNTPNSDNFTTLDCSGGGVYWSSSSNNFNYLNPNWNLVNSSGWHGNSTHTDGVTTLAFNINGSNSYLYAGTSTAQGYNGGLFKSTNTGTWSLQPVGTMTNTIPGSDGQMAGNHVFITSIATSGSNIYVGMEGWIYYSTNNGTSWAQLLSPANTVLTDNNDITSLAVNGSNVFAGIYGANGGGVILYNGTSWTKVNSGLTNTLVTSLSYISGSSIVAGTDGGGVFYSSNNGTSWSSINGTGLANLEIRTLIKDGSTLIVGTDGGIFYSTNYSSGSPTWSSVNSSGLTNTFITSIAVISPGSSIAAGTNGGGVFYSTNYQSGSPTWTAINGSGLSSLSISSLAYDGSSNLYIGVCPKWRVMDCSAYDCCGGMTPSDVSIIYDNSLSKNVVSLADGNATECYSNYYDHGTIETYNAKYGYGYFEIFAKTPYCGGIADNLHPAFWPYIDVQDYNYSSGRCDYNHQEFDIFEPGGTQYLGTTNVFGYWQDIGSCSINKTIQSSYTNSTPLYSAYHKYALEWEQNKMTYLFDDAPIYTSYGNYYIQGLEQTQIAAGLDNLPATYSSLDIVPAYYYISYFNYYKLNLNCSNNLTINSQTQLNNYYVSGTAAVQSNITFNAGSSGIILNNDPNYVFRAVNNITINGAFTVPSGTSLTLMPTPCNY